MNLLRKINKISISAASLVFSNFTKWRLGNESIDTDVQMLFPDGIISINKDSKSWISKFQAKNYALFAGDYADLIKKYSLKDKDIFIGREDNYLLFRNGDLEIKTKNLNIDCDDINITVANKIKINDIELTFVAGKMLIGDKEIAVVGGSVDPESYLIETSGQ